MDEERRVCEGRAYRSRRPRGVAARRARPRAVDVRARQESSVHPHLVVRQRVLRRPHHLRDERVLPPRRSHAPRALRGHFLGPQLSGDERYGEPDVYEGGGHRSVPQGAPRQAVHLLRVYTCDGQQLRRHAQVHGADGARAALSGRLHLGFRRSGDPPARTLWRGCIPLRRRLRRSSVGLQLQRQRHLLCRPPSDGKAAGSEVQLSEFHAPSFMGRCGDRE